MVPFSPLAVLYRSNAMPLFHNVTGAVIIISRVPLRGRSRRNEGKRVRVLGMLWYLSGPKAAGLRLIVSCISRQQKSNRLSERLSRVEKLLMDNFLSDSRVFNLSFPCLVVRATS